VTSLMGLLLGSALQLLQPALWGGAVYALMTALGLGLAVGCLLFGQRVALRTGGRNAVLLLACALLAFALCGLRATQFAAQGLAPELEGRDVTVTGVIGAMPQRHETGIRFRLEVESATASGVVVRIPPRIYLGWYGGAIPDSGGLLELQRRAPDLRAGERWRMTLRLKAPHGNSNPHGFDYELWLWEQGLQARGSPCLPSCMNCASCQDLRCASHRLHSSAINPAMATMNGSRKKNTMSRGRFSHQAQSSRSH
jgi:competence protein ComEC